MCVVVIEKPHKKTYTYSSVDTKVHGRNQLPYLFPPNLHLLTLFGLWCKTSRCRFGGINNFPSNFTSSHSSWKTSRCEVGGRIIFPTKPTSTHSSWKMSRSEVDRINNSPANFTSTRFYFEFHAKQVDVNLVGKIVIKSSLNAQNNPQTYHSCCCQHCCRILHCCCCCLNLSSVRATLLVALPLLCTVVSQLCLFILENPLYSSTNNTSWIDYYYLDNVDTTDALIGPL